MWQLKFLVLLSYCRAADTGDCFWFIRSLHFHNILFSSIWGWCGDYVKAVRGNQISHQRACRSELWLCRGDTYCTTEASLTLIRLGTFVMIATYSKSTEVNSPDARQGCGSSYSMCWISHLQFVAYLSAKKENFKYSGGRSVSQRSPQQGCFKTSLCAVWAAVGGVHWIGFPWSIYRDFSPEDV